jgi:hypothetical protein
VARLPLLSEISWVLSVSLWLTGYSLAAAGWACVTLGVVGVAAFRALRRTSRNRGVAAPESAGMLRLHIVLHTAPLGYFAARALLGPDVFMAWLWYVPVLLFFLSGRQLWASLHRATGRNLYRFFVRGNTMVPCMLAVFLALGSWRSEQMGSAMFDRLLAFYLVVHVLVAGRVLALVAEDLAVREAGSCASC